MNTQAPVTFPETGDSVVKDRPKESLYSVSTNASTTEHGGAPSEDYPLVHVARETMAVLSPDRSRTLLTAYYAVPPGGATFKVTRGKIHGPQMGSATTHSISTDKVDVEVNGGKLRFKETFESLAGLGQLTWRLESDSMVLEDNGGALLARFVPEGKEKKDTSRKEGRFEIRRQGLSAAQLEEVIVTCLAELERRRKKPILDGAVLESIAVGNAYDGGGCSIM